LGEKCPISQNLHHLTGFLSFREKRLKKKVDAYRPQTFFLQVMGNMKLFFRPKRILYAKSQFYSRLNYWYAFIQQNIVARFLYNLKNQKDAQETGFHLMNKEILFLQRMKIKNIQR